MQDTEKTQKQLIDELQNLRRRLAELEALKTEHQRIAQALLKSEEKYRLLVENASDAVFIAQDEVLKFCNQKTEEMTGYSRQELSQVPFVHIIHPEDREVVSERHKKRLNGEHPPSKYSFRIISKSDVELWVQLNAVRIDWEGRPATLNFLRDITEERRLEAQLRYSQKMEAIGTLAGGIAHDFNNLLMAIQGYISLMLLDMEVSHPHHEYLTNIEKQIRSAAGLTAQLLGFARKGKYFAQAFNLNAVVKETIDTLARVRKEITIHTELSESPLTVLADKGQIEQVLLNLFANAADAMPGGGDIVFKTTKVTHDDIQGRPYKPQPGDYVKLTVVDTGVGIDKPTQERIFEPFFTSKALGRGTGLGLASVYGIIKGHGGYIDVESSEGSGTTFTIYLPAKD